MLMTFRVVNNAEVSMLIDKDNSWWSLLTSADDPIEVDKCWGSSTIID